MKRLLLIMISGIFSIALQAQNLQISGGNDYSVSLCSNSIVYSWGSNLHGVVVPSTPAATLYATPQAIPGLPTNIRQVDAGSSSTAIAVDCNGRVWTWGSNTKGQLGQGAFGVPAGGVGSVPGIGFGTSNGPAVYVSGGSEMSYAVLSVTGYVLAWGNNGSGQLGYVSPNTSVPGFVQKCSGGNLSNISQIEGGDVCGFALDKSGYVWSWGDQSNNELGRTSGGANSFCADLVQADYNNDGTPDGPLQNIVQLSGGDTHGLAIDNNGAVWSWGGNWGPGQVGHGTTGGNSGLFASKVNAPGNCTGQYISSNVLGTAPFIGDVGQPKAVFIAAGQQSSAVVLNNGMVVTFGSNSIAPGGSGALGQGPAAVSSGCPKYVLTSATTSLTGIVSVSDGDGWYFATDVNNNVYQWGGNSNSTLASQGTTDQSYAVSVSLPTGCNLIAPCASKPFLGSDMALCPNYVLSTIQIGTGYNYLWQYTSTMTGGSTSWTTLANGTSTSFTTTTGSNFGSYRLLISDTRGSLGTLCGSCPTVGDTVQFTPPPCASNPNLGASLQVCQPVSQTLNSNLTGGSLVFKWEYSSTSSTSGFSTILTGAGINTYSASLLGFYRVSVINNTTCSGCIPTGTSVIQLSTAPSTFLGGPSSICSTVSGSGVFSITTSAGGGSYFWYTNPSGGSALNTAAGLNISGISLAQTTTLAGCSGSVLYVQDQSNFAGTIIPSPLAAGTTFGTGAFGSLPGVPCSGTGNSQENGNRVPIMIEITRDITINSVDIIMDSYGFNYSGSYTFEVLKDDVTGATNNGPNCGSCTPSNTKPNGIAAQYAITTATTLGNCNGCNPYTIRLPVNITLTSSGATRYWLRINGQVHNFSCSPALTYTSEALWTTPYQDNSGQNVAKANLGYRDGSWGFTGAMYNIKFSAGNVAACNRIPVCATLTCPALNVSYYDIMAEKVIDGALVKWTTVSEENSDRFVVERSYDGVSFEAIGTIKSKGNSNGWVDYNFLDGKPGKGTVYYRLVEFDLDNSYYISKIVAVNISSFVDFNVVPNPNNGNFIINANITSSIDFTLQLTNSLGMPVFISNESSNGNFTKEFSLNALSSGVYFVSIKAGDNYIVKKILVE